MSPNRPPCPSLSLVPKRGLTNSHQSTKAVRLSFLALLKLDQPLRLWSAKPRPRRTPTFQNNRIRCDFPWKAMERLNFAITAIVTGSAQLAAIVVCCEMEAGGGALATNRGADRRTTPYNLSRFILKSLHYGIEFTSTIWQGSGKMAKQPMAEVFGYPINNITDEAKRHRNLKLCPFNNYIPNCTKDG